TAGIVTSFIAFHAASNIMLMRSRYTHFQRIRMMAVLPGLILSFILAIAGQFLSQLIGVYMMGFPTSPISAIMMAILLGILIRNTIKLPNAVQSGIRFGLVRVLPFGIVLLGIRLSLGE